VAKLVMSIKFSFGSLRSKPLTSLTYNVLKKKGHNNYCIKIIRFNTVVELVLHCTIGLTSDCSRMATTASTSPDPVKIINLVT
jgi:hypothetical protein